MEIHSQAPFYHTVHSGPMPIKGIADLGNGQVEL